MFKNIIPRKGVQASPDLQGGSCAKRFRTPWQPQDPELSFVTCVCRWPWELHQHPAPMQHRHLRRLHQQCWRQAKKDGREEWFSVILRRNVAVHIPRRRTFVRIFVLIFKRR